MRGSGWRVEEGGRHWRWWLAAWRQPRGAGVLMDGGRVGQRMGGGGFAFSEVIGEGDGGGEEGVAVGATVEAVLGKDEMGDALPG